MTSFLNMLDKVRIDVDAVKRRQEIISRAVNGSKTALAVLKEAEKKGLSMNKYMFASLEGVHASYSPFFNVILLNTHSSDEQLASTIVHEARHACQIGRKFDYKNDALTTIMQTRVPEADAMAIQCAAAYEMGVEGTDDKVWKAFCAGHSEIAKAYREEKEKGKGQTALSAAFQAWFDDVPYVNSYDKGEAESISGRGVYSDSFSSKISSKEILQDLCVFDGSNYMSSAINFLETPRALWVTESVFNMYKARSEKQQSSYAGAKGDTSLRALSVYKRGGIREESANDKRLKKTTEFLTKNSPTANEIIEDFIKKGGQLKYREELGDAVSGYAEESKTVYINPVVPTSEAAFSMLSSIQALRQPRHLQPNKKKDIKGAIMSARALEADKRAIECAVSFEMKDAAADYWQGFKRNNPEMAVAYVKAMKQAQSRDVALAEAFMSWYDNKDAVAVQDNKTLDFVKMLHADKEAFTQKGFSFTILPGHCKTSEDNYYFKDENFFDSKRALTVDEKIERSFQAVAGLVETLQGRRDASVDDLYVRRENGRISEPKSKPPEEKKKIFGQAFASLFKGKKGKI